MTKNKNDELVFAPLGGVGEIGMNFALYGFGPAHSRQWLIVDCGVTFPGPELPGVDLVLPDTRFIEAEKDRLLGMIITHAHEDHYGAVLDLWPRLKCPVWMSPFAAGMLASKHASDAGRATVPVTIFEAGDKIELGPLSVEPIIVSHSIPEPFSLAITTPLGTVLHTGDWKFDPAPALGPLTDEKRFGEVGDAGVLAMICDSTNALREGESPTEREVSDSLQNLIEEAPGRVVITTFSSNVGRIRAVMEAARDAGRQVLVLGRSIQRVLQVADEQGYLEGLPDVLDEEQFGFIPRDKAVIVCTGSQGEARAALAKLSRDEMRNVALSPGDTVIFSSRIIPGNEAGIIEIKNALIDRGMRVIEDDDALVHVSGHPRRDELRRMYNLIKPQISVPVHGEAQHLVAHAELARAEGIREIAEVRNGDLLRLAPGSAEVIGEVPHGRLFKDGKIFGDDQQVGVRMRRKLSFAGHVCVNVLLDNRHMLLDDPDIEALGLPEMDEQGEDLEDILLEAAIGAIESVPPGRRKNLDKMADSVRRAVRASARELWGKKPLVTVFVTRV